MTVAIDPTRLSIDDLPGAADRLEPFVRFDGFANVITGLGLESHDPRVSTAFRRGRQIQPAEYCALYEENPRFRRIVDTLPMDATRNWISVQGSTDDDAEDDFGRSILDALEELDAQQKFYEWMRLARLDGGSAMILGADDGLDPKEPIDLNRVQSLEFLNVVTRWEIQPTDFDVDPTSRTFRQPMAFTFNTSASASSIQAGDRIHHSRVLRLRGIVATEYPHASIGGLADGFSNQYWGVPIAQHLHADIRQFDTSYDYVEACFKQLSQGVFGMHNLAEILSTTQGNEKLMKRLALIKMAASSFNMVLYDPAHESYEIRANPITGIDGVLVRFSEKLGSAAGMPLTKLFGMPPAGLSTDDKSGEKSWNTTVANEQKRVLKRPIEKVIDILFHAKRGPTGGNVPDDWSLIFNPLDEPDEAHEASTRKIEAETDAVHLNNGTLSPIELRSRLINDPSCPYVLDKDFDGAAKLVYPLPPTEAETPEEVDLLRAQPPTE